MQVGVDWRDAGLSSLSLSFFFNFPVMPRQINRARCLLIICLHELESRSVVSVSFQAADVGLSFGRGAWSTSLGVFDAGGDIWFDELGFVTKLLTGENSVILMIK